MERCNLSFSCTFTFSLFLSPFMPSYSFIFFNHSSFLSSKEAVWSRLECGELYSLEIYQNLAEWVKEECLHHLSVFSSRNKGIWCIELLIWDLEYKIHIQLWFFMDFTNVLYWWSDGELRRDCYELLNNSLVIYRLE